MSPFEVVQAIQSAGVGVVGLDLRRTVVVLRFVDLAKRRWYVSGAFPIESTNSADPRRGKWNATQWFPPRSYVSVLMMNVRGRRHHQYRHISNRGYPPPPPQGRQAKRSGCSSTCGGGSADGRGGGGVSGGGRGGWRGECGGGGESGGWWWGENVEEGRWGWGGCEGGGESRGRGGGCGGMWRRVEEEQPDLLAWWPCGGGYPWLLICLYWWWHRTFIVNTDTCDRGGSHWAAFHFPLVGSAEFIDSPGNAPETYHHRFANVNEPQYYYCSSQFQPDDIDTCRLYCLYYFKRRHRGTRTKF